MTTACCIKTGAGLLSANALRPYKRWKEFRPNIEIGVNAMLKTRPPAEKELSFSSASVRYINAFSGDLQEGTFPAVFIKDVLGLSVKLPQAIEELVDANRVVNSNSSLLIPIANTSKVMSLTVGDGVIGTETAAIFDVTVNETEAVKPDIAEVMQVLDLSRAVIYDCFMQVTEPIRHLLRPQGR